MQLCAQALCLEEMLGCAVPAGALFYGKKRRRQQVAFDDDLREETRLAAKRLHALIDSGMTPPAVYGKKCDTCSLVEICLPKVTDGRDSVNAYLGRITEVA